LVGAAGLAGVVPGMVIAPPPAAVNRCGSCEMMIGGPAPHLRELCHGCAFVAAPLVEGASYGMLHIMSSCHVNHVARYPLMCYPFDATLVQILCM
jgi:hypothetical protein